MSDLNYQAYTIIEKIEAQSQFIDSHIEAIQKRALYAEEQLAILHLDFDKTKQEISRLQQVNQTQQDSLTSLQKEFEKLKNSEKLAPAIIQQPENVSIDNNNLELHQKIIILEAQNQALDEKYKSAYSLLQKEMVKVDTMQMELELAQRERDIALRKQSLTPEQKQLLIKLEHENYKINESIERIDYISEALRKILTSQVENI
jgi:hypothetical protein